VGIPIEVVIDGVIDATPVLAAIAYIERGDSKMIKER
jgi:hypothetical protein